MSSREPIEPSIPPTTRSGTPTATGTGPSAKESGKQAAKEVGGTARQGAAEVAETAKEQVGHVAVEAREHARQVATEMGDDLHMRADEQAHRVAEGLRTVSGQLQALSEGRMEEAGAIGNYAREACHRLDSLAGRIDAKGIDGVTQDLRNFARRRPGMFLLGAAAAGFAVGRIARSARDDNNRRNERAPYRPAATVRRDTPVVTPAGAAVVDLTGTDAALGSAGTDRPGGYPPRQPGV
jgi:hypothetical protein